MLAARLAITPDGLSIFKWLSSNMLAYKVKFYFVVFISMLFVYSCSNGTGPEEYSPVEISEIVNIQWNLVSVEESAVNVDLNQYEPFKIVFWNDRIWGTDSCNYLRGDYSVKNDRLTIKNGGITLIGCSSFKNFPFQHLFQNPRLMMNGAELVLLKNDTTHVYNSNFAKKISQQNFMNETLRLENSNDNGISFFDSLGIYPELILNNDREFNLKWYNKSPENTSMINQRSGVYGINANKEILFTSINSSYSGNGHSIEDMKLVNRLIQADKYEYKNSILRIMNTKTSTYYEFKK